MNTNEVAIRCGEHAFTRLQKLLPQQDRLLPKIYQTTDVSSSYHFTKAELNRLHADCVHAHAGTALRNDEIIFFDENAMVLNYIVEFQ